MGDIIAVDPDDLDPREAMQGSEYLSATSLAANLSHAVEHLLPIAAKTGDEWAGSIDRLLLVGSGGSYAALLTAQYALESLVQIPVTAIPGKEIPWRDPAWVDSRTAVVYVSYSGETADVMEALTYLSQRNVRSIAITASPNSSLATQCDVALVYQGAPIYEVPIVLVLAFALHVVNADAGLLKHVRAQAADMEGCLVDASNRMSQMALRLRSAEHVYVVGAGPQSSLALKLAAVLMENVRIGASYIDGSEMRHGPIEMVADRQPTILGLLGTDESRSMTAGVLRFLADRGCTVEVIDAMDLGVRHPLLAPLVLNPWTQWLVAWSAWQRGIADLDERIFMGKGLLSPGAWP